MLKLMYLTNKSYVARIAEQAGVDRIFIDLEYLGKAERQSGLDSVKSNHQDSDISAVKNVLRKAELLVRINPINKDSAREINSVITEGADIVMLPMFKSIAEVEQFLNFMYERGRGNVKAMLLLEHIDAVNCLDDILAIEGIDEIHIGLNDLHLSMNQTFLFEPLANGLIDDIVVKIKARGIPFGIGGVSRIGTGDLLAEMILAEHYRLHSTGVILSRSFCNLGKVAGENELYKIFTNGVMQIRDYERLLIQQDDSFFKKNQAEVKNRVNEIVRQLSKEKENGI